MNTWLTAKNILALREELLQSIRQVSLARTGLQEAN
jgi:hypothetical protein